MNWTGGNLHRLKGARRGAVTKQKQHFANARTKLQNGSDAAAKFMPSFIHRGLGSVEPNNDRISSSRSQGRQTKLEDYRDIAPMVKKLSSLAPKSYRSSAYTVQTKFSTKAINAVHPPDTDRRIFDLEKYVLTGSAFPSSISTYSPKQREYFDNPISATNSAANSVAVAAQYKPRAQPSKDNRHNTNRLKDHERKRRELLERVDWMGLNSTKPLQMDFMSDRGKEKVAKRRKLDDLDNARQQGAIHGRMRLPSIGERPEDFMMSGALNPEKRLQNGTIRIRIGDDALISQTDAMSKVGSQKARTLSPESILLHETGEEGGPQLLDHRRSLSNQDETSTDAAQGSFRASASLSQDNGANYAQHPASASSSQHTDASNGCAPTQFAVYGSATGSDSSRHAEHPRSQVEDCTLAEDEKTWRELLRVYDGEKDEIKAQNGRKYESTLSPDDDLVIIYDQDAESHKLSKYTSDGTTSEHRVWHPAGEFTNNLELTGAKSKNPRKDPDAIWKGFDYGSGTDSPPSSQDKTSGRNEKGPTASMRVQIPPSPYEFVGQSSRTHRPSKDSSILMLATGREKAKVAVHRSSEAKGRVDQKHKRRLRHELSASTPSSITEGQVPSSLSFDRPSSVANASITAAVLSNNQFARRKLQVAKGLTGEARGKTDGQVRRGISTFSRPKPIVSALKVDGGSGSWYEDGFLQDDMMDSD